MLDNNTIIYSQTMKMIQVILFTIIMLSCGGTTLLKNEQFTNIRNIRYISKDSIKSVSLTDTLKRNNLPSLDEFGKSYFKDVNLNKFNTFYVYYDSISGRMFTIKEVINDNDTIYIMEKKDFEIEK